MFKNCIIKSCFEFDFKYFNGTFCMDNQDVKNGIIREIINYKESDQKFSEIFEVIYFNDVKSGWGRHIQNDGSYYIGFYKNNKRNGSGTLFSKKGIIIQ